MSGEGPRLVVVGGPNGCGKTTFARTYAEGEGSAYLGADDIALRLSPQNPQAARVAAGRAFGREFSEALEARRSLVVESTLSGGSFVRYVERAWAKGYAVTVVFVSLGSVEHCLRRIVERVAQGGHDVPEADVRRRYGRAFGRFWKDYRALANDWMLVDNGGDAFVRIADGEGDEVTVYDEAVWSWFVGQANAQEGEEHDGERTEAE